MKYVDVMMNRGHPIEFFIEGGRSRTGRLLRPRTGMLTMTVRSFLRDTRRPVAYVPVYFGYDRLLEGESYIDELLGRPKQKESVGGLLRVLPQLRRENGHVHIAFGEPLLLDGVLDRLHAEWRGDVGDDGSRPAWFGEAVEEVANEILRRVNSAAAVTHVNLLSVVLLAAPRQAMLEHDLERQLQLYIDLLRAFPYSPDVSVAAKDGAEIIESGEQMGLLERRKHPLGDVLRMAEQNAVLATYYRNNVLHLFALPSLVACAFLNNTTMRHEDIQRLVWRVYPYIRAELFLRWREDELPGVVDGVLAALAQAGLLEPDHRALRPRHRAAAACRSVHAVARLARTALRRHGAAHVHALRPRGAGILRSRDVPGLHRAAARPRRRAPGRGRAIDLRRSPGRGRRRRARRALRADSQQHPAGHAQLKRSRFALQSGSAVISFMKFRRVLLWGAS
jgi:glycerol-3-phosphate O-acyltransferase